MHIYTSFVIYPIDHDTVVPVSNLSSKYLHTKPGISHCYGKLMVWSVFHGYGIFAQNTSLRMDYIYLTSHTRHMIHKNWDRILFDRWEQLQSPPEMTGRSMAGCVCVCVLRQSDNRPCYMRSRKQMAWRQVPCISVARKEETWPTLAIKFFLVKFNFFSWNRDMVRFISGHSYFCIFIPSCIFLTQ